MMTRSTTFSRRTGIRLAAACLLAGLGGVAAADVSILPLGDSITAGNGYGGYRAQLATDLTAAGHTFHLLGSQVMQDGGETAASLRPPYDGLHHEGHGGWRIDQLDANLDDAPPADASANGGYFITGGNGTGRAAIFPDVVLVLAGINDVNQYFGQKADAGQVMDVNELLPILQGRMTSLIDNLSTLRPDANILLSNVIPYANGLLSDQVTGATTAQREIWAAEDGVSPEQELGVNHYVIQFNKWLENEFVPQQQTAGVKIELVDQYQNFILPDGSVRGWSQNAPDGYADYGLHPNQFGYDLMGATWAEAIGELLAVDGQFEAVVDRHSGAIVLTNISGEDLAVTSLSISSAQGAIAGDELTPISGVYDGAGNGQVDQANWSVLTDTPSLFRETAPGATGSIAAGVSLQLSPAGGWLASPTEDLLISVELADGTTSSALVSYSGNDGEPLSQGDLNADGVVDRDDYLILAHNAEESLTGLTPVQTYLKGDLNGDGLNDYEDFRIFKRDYIEVNGEAAFAAMLVAPEPAAAGLGTVLLAAVATLVRRRAAGQGGDA